MTEDPRLTVFLDACVLYPAPLRDFLLHLAAGGLYKPKWTDHIHEQGIFIKTTELYGEQVTR